MSQNPLTGYFRTVENYITLPSGTSYYSDDVITFNNDGEVGILPMTSKDELNLKSPDGLLNGSAIEEMLKSCIPTLKEPKLLLQMDVDTLTVAIRRATYGDTMDFSVPCPKCENETNYALDLSEVLGASTKLEDTYFVELEQGLKIQVKPTTFDSTMKTTKIVFDNYRMTQTMNEDQQVQFLAEVFQEMSKLNFDMVAENIVSISAPNIEEPVTNKEHIKEFIMNINAKDAETITNLVKEIDKIGLPKQLPVSCPECGHEWENETAFDPMRFFTQS